MFGKMMNRFYYGKSGKGDFTKEDLPQNRWQLFWEMLRVRFSALIRLNLMYMVVWLPTIFIIVNLVLVCLSGLSETQPDVATGTTEIEATAVVGTAETEADVAAGTDGVLAEDEAYQSFLGIIPSLILQALLLLIPCIAITGPFTAGVAYVTRNWARDEHAFIWSDFWDAVKANWKQGLLVSLITSLMPAILYVCYQFYGEMAQQSMLYIIPQVLCVMVAFIWLCSLTYMYPQMVTYKLTFRGLVRNSLIMAVGRLPMSVGLKLLSLVPVALGVVVSLFTPYFQYALMIIILYYVLIGFTLSRFVGASYANAVFDHYINPNIEGAEVNRGLYVEEDEDDEDASAGEEALSKGQDESPDA